MTALDKACSSLKAIRFACRAGVETALARFCKKYGDLFEAASRVELNENRNQTLVVNCDLIYFLDQGKFVDQGAYGELLKSYKLFRSKAKARK